MQDSENMQKCGFCSVLSGIFRRALCVNSRRGSSESYYKELGDQDTLKIDDKTSDGSDESHEFVTRDLCVHSIIASTGEQLSRDDEGPMALPPRITGRFHTVQKRRRKRLVTRSLNQEYALLDDFHHGQIECLLEKSAHWRFNSFTLESLSGGRCIPALCIHLFHWYGLIKHFRLDTVRLWKLFSLIEEGYHSANPYHNSVHAADVTQAMHCFLQQKQILEYVKPLEIMACLIGAMAHDVDHPGVNQPFLIATSNHLASLYQNTSVLENHHWRMAISCMTESGLLNDLPDIRSELEQLIGTLILATDITRQQEFLNRFKALLDKQTLDLSIEEHRHFVLQIALKCADISNPCRPWNISRKWSLRVCEEFFRQGDYERKLSIPVTALCDRHTTSIPKIQAGFFKYVVTPLAYEWHRFLQNELSSEMIANLEYNETKWECLLAQELADETRTEISDADIVEDDLETYSITNISDSSERLLPERRSSLQVKELSAKEEMRRFSVPLNMFETKKSKSSSQGSIVGVTAESSESDSERSLHSTLSVYRNSDDDKEKVLSTEKLLPDTTIATITTPNQATRLSHVFRESGWRLFRQQTFPPLAMGRLYTGRAFEGQFYSTECDHSEHEIMQESDNLLAKINESGDTENEPMKPSTSGRRESAPVGLQYRENLASVQLDPSNDMIPKRRLSVPTEMLAAAAPSRERRLVDIFKGRRQPGSYERRGSAPASSDRVRDSLSLIISRQNSIKCRQQANTAELLAPAAAMFHMWFKKSGSDPQPTTSALQRRSSLPVEALSGSIR